jgi:hypothetical protein
MRSILPLWVGLALLAACIGESRAQVLLDGSTYNQDLNSLSASGGSNPWTDGVTLPGWYAQKNGGAPSTYAAGSGTSTSGGLYSFGASGASDRSLGALASSGTGAVGFGLQVVNNTGSALSGFLLSFDAEQWRNSGATVPHDLTFSFRTAPGALPSLDLGTGAEWVSVPALGFQGPAFGAPSGALDGKSDVNRTVFSRIGLDGVVLQNGEALFMRWIEADHTGSDHAFAVDNVRLEYSPVPEPAAAPLAAAFAALCVALWRRTARR